MAETKTSLPPRALVSLSDEVKQIILKSQPDFDLSKCNVNVCVSQPFIGWCEIEYCKVCKQGPFQRTFEVSWTETVGDQTTEHYVSEMCHACYKKLWQRDPEGYDPIFLASKRNALRQRDVWPEFGDALIALAKK